MTTHLHVHLEPNERKRRRLGKAKQRYSDAAQFFSEHSPTNPDRLSVDLDDLKHFICDFHSEQRSQDVSYVELRLSPRRFLSTGVTLSDVLNTASRTASDLESPTIKLILLLNRDSSDWFIDSCKNAITDGLPKQFAGIDLAGDEVKLPDVRRFESFFGAARSAGLGITVHAGEFGDADNIWRALDQLGADRIAHAVSSAGCRQLARRLCRDQILVEASVSSNVALGAVPSLKSHPLPWLVGNDVPVSLNADVPLHLGTELNDEWHFARLLLSNDSPILDSMETSARLHRFSRN